MAQSGVFISKAGYRQAKQLFDDMKGSDNVRILPKVRSLVAEAWGSAKVDFDTFYAALYGMTLLGDAESQIHAREGTRIAKPLIETERAGTLRVLLDMHLKRYKPGLSFERTLPSEYAVADLLMFDREVRRKIPYELAFENVGLGCVWLEYGIYANLGGSDPNGLPFLEKDAVEGRAEDAEGKYWRDLMDRYHVAGVELDLERI